MAVVPQSVLNALKELAGLRNCREFQDPEFLETYFWPFCSKSLVRRYCSMSGRRPGGVPYVDAILEGLAHARPRAPWASDPSDARF